jgi:serine/threonine-protein kinase
MVSPTKNIETPSDWKLNADHPAMPKRPASPGPTDKPAAPPWLGKRVGHFKLVGLLGQGAMGRVFRVEDTLLKRYVALKVLPKSVKHGEKTIAIERLIHEAQAVATLEHPNVVNVYEVNESAGVYYIAMELAEGGSLRDLIKAAGPLEYARACVLGADAADALSHAHELGIVHRDVKPANLMLTRAGRCKVTDFGLARGVETSDLSKPIPESVGTPQFIAPELLRGEVASAKSDIYSLAATIWYLLTGRPVFEATGTEELFQKHLQAPLPDLTLLRPDIPPKLAGALQKALAKNPADRFDSMSQFARVLRVYTIPLPAAAPAHRGSTGDSQEDTAFFDLPVLSLRNPTAPSEQPEGRGRSRNGKAWIGAGAVAAAVLIAALVPWKSLVHLRSANTPQPTLHPLPSEPNAAPAQTGATARLP